MKVIVTYFLKCVPGLPVYEMADGTLRMPFAKKKGEKIFFYMSLVELTTGITDLAVRAQFTAPFEKALEEIIKLKQLN